MALRPDGDLAFAVLDVETTGLSPQRGARILEVAVVRVNASGDVLGEYQTLVNPCGPVGATDIHGITAAMIAGAPTFAQVAPAVLGLAQNAVVVAHNASFDLKFMAAEFGALGVPFAPPVLCTMALRSMLALPMPAHGRSSNKLEWACAQHDIPLENAHCALADTRATAALLVRYLQVARELGFRGLGQLGVDVRADPVPAPVSRVVAATPRTRWDPPAVRRV